MFYTVKQFYQSREWKEFMEILAMERMNEDGQLICAHCGKPIVKKYDRIGHHKIELTPDNVNDFSISLNPDNVDIIHFRCHNAIHERFGFQKEKQVYLVYGPPCAGKSTWVKQNAVAGDLVMDLDRIWECISLQDKFNKPDRLKANVFAVRDCILDQIRTRMGKWRNAYIIGSYPFKSERKRVLDVMGAVPVFIDTSKDECMARAKSADWKKFIENWFADFDG